MINVWDANARAIIAFSLALIAAGVIYIVFKLSEKDSKPSKKHRR